MAKDYSAYNIENEGKGELFHRQPLAMKADRIDKKSQFVVEAGDVAFVILNGVRQETLEPGRYLVFDRLFRGDGLAGRYDKKHLAGLSIVYVSNNSTKNNVKWGIPHQEMEMRDPFTQVDFMMGAFGEMTIHVANPQKFFEEWLTGKKEGFSAEDFKDLALAKIKEKVKTAIIKTIREQKIPYHEMDGDNTEKIAKGALSIIAEDFVKHFGIGVSELIINKINVLEDGKKEMRRKYDDDQREIKNKQTKAEAKIEEKEDLAERERLDDKEWERKKYLLEVETKRSEKYMDVTQTIGWEPKAGGTANSRAGGGFCNKCGKPYDQGDEFCPGCGSKIKPDRCACGNLLAEGSVFCNKCGKRAK